MAEKGDVPADIVSLPPTYAPSEAYTESPPPAYRRDKSSRVAIVRMVCVTVVASALIIGFFILTSNYLNARSCTCSQDVLADKNLQAASFVDLPRTGALVGLENNLEDNKAKDNMLEDKQLDGKQLESDGIKDMMTNDLNTENNENLPKPDDQVVNEELPVTEEEMNMNEEQAPEAEEAQRELEQVAKIEAQREEEEEALQDIMRAQMEHMKKIRLPVDLILGNPALAGRDVDCEVERRQQPLGGGIMTQAIIVTCHDNDDDQQPPSGPGLPPPGPHRLGPPLSLLAPIMKMLSARAASRANQPLVPLNNQRPLPIPIAPMPCPGPFPCIMSRSKQMTPPMPSPLSGPLPIPQNLPMHGPIRGEDRSLNHMPKHFPGPVHMVSPKKRPVFTPFNSPQGSQSKIEDGPLNRMLPFPFRPIVRMSPRVPRLLTAPEHKGAPVSLASLHRGALPLSPEPKRENFPRVVPEARGRALPDPINLPGFGFRPGNLMSPAQRPLDRTAHRENPRPITHMEMRAPPPPPKNTVNAEPRIVDFGPPRVHTVIRPAFPNIPPKIQAAPRLITHPPLSSIPHEVHHIHNRPIPKDIMTPPKPIAIIPKTQPIAGPQTTVAPPPPPPPPPPPKFDPKGRTGNIPEINPNAEILIKPQSPPQEPPHPLDPQEGRKHHLLLVN